MVIVNENVFLRRVSRCIMQFGTDCLCMKTHTRLTTILRPGLGILLQWRNRLARRTYSQYLLAKTCGGCEFDPHLEHFYSAEPSSNKDFMQFSFLVSLRKHCSVHQISNFFENSQSLCVAYTCMKKMAITTMNALVSIHDR